MTTRIPTSTSVTESAVISAPLAQVWHLIKLQDFHNFWSKLEKSDYVKGASPETDVVQWTFKDGTVLDVKQEEHSVPLPSSIYSYYFETFWGPLMQKGEKGDGLLIFLQTIDHYITYSVIASTPALTYSSVISTLRCFAVTSGANEGSTFVQWSAHFSSDADAGVIEDARFKRKEALADLAGVAGKK
ncbi:MAG: hypothetical protein Q9188_005171 [Gyalolechia gomerana]